MTEMTKMTSNPFHCIAALKIAYKSNSTRLATHETQEHVAYDEVLNNKAPGFIKIDLDDDYLMIYNKQKL
jgi:hypothetical protein